MSSVDFLRERKVAKEENEGRVQVLLSSALSHCGFTT